MASLRGRGRVVLVVSVCGGQGGCGVKVGLFFMGSLHGVLSSEEGLGQWDTHSLTHSNIFQVPTMCHGLCWPQMLHGGTVLIGDLPL